MKTNILPLSSKIRIKNIKKNSFKKLNKEFNKAIIDINYEIKNPKTTLSILGKEYKFNFKINDLKKFKKFKKVALVGMGGSILGSKAIYFFLRNKIKKKFYFFDDINEKKLLNFKKKENFKKVFFLIISKSGNTVETLSNAITLKIFKRSAKNIIIISEKKDNSLFYISKKYNLFFVEHKNFISGRYSLFSETGIIPAYLMGLNINKFRSKILNVLRGKDKLILKDSSLKLVSCLKSKRFNNLIFLNYSPELEQFLFWCQQLIAESLGKNRKGFLPVISSAPKDHHSLLQLYLDGPNDKLFYIFSYEESSKYRLNVNQIINKNSYLDKKSLSNIKKAQKNALIKSLYKNKIPFREFKIQTINEEVLGKLFSFFIIETVILGKLLKINPFDQPAVELIKKETKKILL